MSYVRSQAERIAYETTTEIDDITTLDSSKVEKEYDMDKVYLNVPSHFASAEQLSLRFPNGVDRSFPIIDGFLEIDDGWDFYNLNEEVFNASGLTLAHVHTVDDELDDELDDDFGKVGTIAPELLKYKLMHPDLSKTNEINGAYKIVLNKKDLKLDIKDGLITTDDQAVGQGLAEQFLTGLNGRRHADPVVEGLGHEAAGHLHRGESGHGRDRIADADAKGLRNIGFAVRTDIEKEALDGQDLLARRFRQQVRRHG